MESRDEYAIGVNRGTIRLVTLVAVPILVGLAMGKTWPDAQDQFYSSVAQIIATLFIAIAVEFLPREAVRKEAFDRLRIVLLIAISWSGFFACIRALAGEPSSLTVGFAGAGVTAASVLVSLDLYEKVAGRDPEARFGGVTGPAILILFLVAPVLLLIVPSAVD